MLIGYVRVSTAEQNLDLQIDALKKAGCEQIFEDKGISGAKAERTGLNKALTFLREGDVLVVWKLDRLGRSLPHLVEVVNGLKSKGIQFKSLQEEIDTTTPTGKFTFHLFCALAEFERDLIRSRVNAGMAAARARGRVGGRPTALSPEKVEIGKTLASNPEMSVKQICEHLGCSRSTYYRQIAPRVPDKQEKSA